MSSYVQDWARDIPLPRPTPSQPISLRRELKDSHDDFLFAFDSPYPTESCIYCVQISSRFILLYYECEYADETIYLLSKSRELVVRHNNSSGLWFGGVFHNLWHTRVSNKLNTVCQFYLTNRHSVFFLKGMHNLTGEKVNLKKCFFFIIGSIFDMLRRI